jgi:lipid A disaccharide synthetase
MIETLSAFSGVLVNTLTVIIGSSVGLLLKKQIPEKLTNAVMTAIGLCTIAIGVTGVIKGENQQLLSVSDSLILASGTVALEATLYQTPMLIAYRGPWFFYLVYLLVRCIKRVSLPNIIADKEIVKELIQHKLSVKNIVEETEKLLFDENYRTGHIEELGKIKSMLSDKISAEEVAKSIIKSL